MKEWYNLQKINIYFHLKEERYFSGSEVSDIIRSESDSWGSVTSPRFLGLPCFLALPLVSGREAWGTGLGGLRSCLLPGTHSPTPLSEAGPTGPPWEHFLLRN